MLLCPSCSILSNSFQACYSPEQSVQEVCLPTASVTARSFPSCSGDGQSGRSSSVTHITSGRALFFITRDWIFSPIALDATAVFVNKDSSWDMQSHTQEKMSVLWGLAANCSAHLKVGVPQHCLGQCFPNWWVETHQPGEWQNTVAQSSRSHCSLEGRFFF